MADFYGEAVLHDHRFCRGGGIFQILGSPCRDIVKCQLFRDAAAQRHDDILQHPAAGIEQLIPLRQRHRVARRAHARRDDGHRVNRSHIREHMEEDRMARFMISGNPPVLLGNDFAPLFSPDPDLDKCRLDIILHDVSAVCLRGTDGRFIEKVLQIGSGEAGRRLRDLLQVHVVAEGLSLCVDFQDRFPALDVRHADRDLAVKTAGTKDRRIEDVHTVCGRHHDDAFIDAKTVHLDEELVQGLLSLIMAAAKPGASASRHRIDLIDEDDAGVILLGVLKEVADTARADADEHFHEIRTGNGEERNTRLPGHGLRDQCLTGSRRAHQDHALWNAGAHMGVFGRIFQEIHDFLQVLLLLLEAGHVVKVDAIFRMGIHLGPALAEVQHLRVGTAARRAVHEHQQHKHQHGHHQHRENGTHEDRILLDIFDRHRNSGILLHHHSPDRVYVRIIKCHPLPAAFYSINLSGRHL